MPVIHPRRWFAFFILFIAGITLSLNAPIEIGRSLWLSLVIIATIIIMIERHGFDRRWLTWAYWRSTLHHALATLQAWRSHALMRLIARIMALISLAVLLYAWHAFMPMHFRHQGLYGWSFVGLAFVLALLPFWVFFPHHIGALRAQPAPKDEPIRWRWLLLGVLLWLILVQSTLIPPFFSGALPHHLQAGLFVGGIVLMTLGAGGWHRAMWAGLRPRRSWLPMLAVLMLALLVRVYDLEYGIHRFVDEIHFASAVARLWYADTQPLLMPHDSITAFTWLYPYLQSWTASLTGASLSGLRLASVIFGVVQVWAIHELTRHLVNRRAAWFVAITLATFPPHVHFSRIGLNNIADPTFGILAFAFFVRGLRRRWQMDFALSGIMLGMTTYFYEGGRLFYAPFMMLWLGWLAFFVKRDLHHTLPTRRHWAIFGGGALMLISSFYYIWATNGVRLFPRYETIDGNFDGVLLEILTGDVLRVFWDYAQVPLMNYVHTPSTDSFFHGSQPYIIWWTVPFFLIGWAVALWRIRRLDGALIFWWMAGVTVANMVMGPLIQSPRYVVGYPALAMCVGLGVYWAVEWGGAALGRFNRTQARRLLGGVLLGYVCISQLIYYHGDFLPMYYERQFYHEYVYGVPVRDADDVLLRTVRLPEGTYVHYISPEFFGGAGYGAVLTYYNRHRDLNFQTLYPQELTATYLLALPPTATHAFFIEPDDHRSYLLLRDYFDLTGPEFSPFPIPPERQMALYMAYPSQRSLNDERRWQNRGGNTP